MEARDFEDDAAAHQADESDIEFMIRISKHSKFFLIKLNITDDVVHADLDMQHIAGIALSLPLAPLNSATEGHYLADCPSFSGTLLLNEAWKDHRAEKSMHRFKNASGILWIGR